MTLGLLNSFGKQGTTTSTPSFPTIDSAEATKKATKLVEAIVTHRTLDAIIKSSKGDLRQVAYDEFIRANRGAGEHKTSVIIPTIRDTDGKVAHDLIVTFTEGYTVIDSEKFDAVSKIVGQDFAKANFAETFSLAINSAAVPTDKRDALLKGMISLMEKLGIDPQEAVKAKGGYATVDGFNQLRINELSSAVNTKLEEILPTPASVGEYKKTKTDAKANPAAKKPAAKRK